MDVTIKIAKPSETVSVKVNAYTVTDAVESGKLVVMIQKAVAKLAKKNGWLVC